MSWPIIGQDSHLIFLIASRYNTSSEPLEDNCGKFGGLACRGTQEVENVTKFTTYGRTGRFLTLFPSEKLINNSGDMENLI